MRKAIPAYAALLNVSDRLAVVIGGGGVAARKVQGLHAAGARVRVVAPDLVPPLAARAHRGEVQWWQRRWQAGDCGGAAVVVAATANAAVNRQVAAEAHALGVLVNVVDEPAEGSFLVPAVVRRGDLVLAVGTGGRAPGLAGAVRRRLERQYGPEWGALTSALGDLRGELPRASDDGAWDQLLSDAVLRALRDGDPDFLRDKVKAWQSSLQA